ncbi:NADH-quinone oxidoreductase subunit NuoK [Calderihabitans maritimus]|uniref:NADH-quinone oxidoreductase subunit K n=1 Tax=Calderihabitans maritimus TaxID=1246530 RepID=A0A1Z5HXN3_9FIRM|nr:NADH-quinone oxidoreductase subunit NuoK [Calderihabitans maritimus]GAW94178.1 NADH-ubiquinone oxidoreductase chain 4L [Calderihabitans maritimus]
MALVNYLVIGAIVFSIGAFGVLTRRNVVFVFMCLELMFTGVGITLVAFSRYFAPDLAVGYIFVIFMLTVAAAETALGLGIFLAVQRKHGTISTDEFSNLKG